MQRIQEVRDVLKTFSNWQGLLEGLFAFSPLALQVYDATGKCLFVNDTFKKTFGAVPPPEYCVFKDEQSIASGYIEYVHRAFKGEIVQTPVFWFDPKKVEHVKVTSGHRVALESLIFPIFQTDQTVSHVVFMYKDVTSEQGVREDHQIVKKKLDDANTLIQNFLDNTKAVIYFKALDGKYIHVNTQWLRVFELSLEQVAGKDDYEIFSKPIADGFVQSDKMAMQSASHIEIEESAIHADGTTRTYLSLKFPMFDAQGKVNGVCGTSTDITEHKRLQLELSQARRMESLGVLAGGIAHDFNNVLGLILLQADDILEQSADEQIKKSAQMIVDSASRAATLTRQLLAFGRQQALGAQVIDVNQTMNDLKTVIERALGEGIDLAVDLESELWKTRCNPSQMEQILLNLCLNARDAMPRGGRLHVSTHNTVLTSQRKMRRIGAREGEYVEIRVTDSGEGMTKEISDRVFEPFFTTKDKSKGSGLGLSSVFGIVQQNNGEIVLESDVGVGTRISVFLPKVDADPVSETEKISEPKIDSCGQETILMIEDNLELREITATRLRRHGYKVLEARDLASARAALQTLNAPVDLVISDVIMPGLSGPEIVKTLAEENRIPHAQVLFVSGYSENQLEQHHLSKDSVSLLEKPYSAVELLSRVRRLLDASKHVRSVS